MPDASPKRSISLPRVQSRDQARLETWVQCIWTQARLLRRVEQLLAEHGVTLPQFDVLSNLLLCEGLTQQELAARLQSTKGNMVGLLDRMEKQKWVERRPDQKDGRVNRLFLTPHGRKQLQLLRPIHDQMVLRLLDDLTDDDLAAFRQTLITLDSAIDTKTRFES